VTAPARRFQAAAPFPACGQVVSIVALMISGRQVVFFFHLKLLRKKKFSSFFDTMMKYFHP